MAENTLKHEVIAQASELQEADKGIRFDVKQSKSSDACTIPAFVIRYDNKIHAYLNKCGHIAMQLDYTEGQFFNDEGDALMCSTHGAEYAPDTGKCLGGPCYGVGLEPLAVSEVDGNIVLNDSDYEVINV